MLGISSQKDEVKDISEYAFQALFDMITLKIMSLEFSPVELVNKMTGTLVLPIGKDFASEPVLTSKTGELELWLTEEYDYHRNKAMLIHLNTIFENYLYNFAKLWIERRKSILDECTVSLKQVMEKSKTEIFDEKMDSHIQNKLLYGSYSEVFKNFRTIIKADISASNDLNAILDEFYEIRNILIHSNGIIGGKLVKLFPDNNYKTGEKLVLEPKYINNMENQLRNQILKIDKYLIKNFPELAVKSSSEVEEVGIRYTYT